MSGTALLVLAAGVTVGSPAAGASVPGVRASTAVAPKAGPVVGSLSRAAGPVAGGTTVTLTGSGFVAVKKVLFGSTAGTRLKVVSSRKLVVVTPRHTAGAVDVRVQVKRGSKTVTSAKSSRARFIFVAPPVVSAVTPASGPPGGRSAVTVTGSGFVKVSKVLFGAAPGTSVKVVSAARLTVVTPAHAAGAFNIQVVGGFGTSALSARARFTFVDKTAPRAVTGLRATATTATSVTLGWVNPTDADLAGTVVRRATGPTAPATATSGTAVASPAKPTATVSDSGLVPGTTYSYAVFARDSANNVSPAVNLTLSTAADGGTDPGTSLQVSRLQATPIIDDTGSAAVALTWLNPPAAAFAGVTIRRAVGTSAPRTATDGRLVTDVAAPGHTVTDHGLDPGATYSYAVFARDRSSQVGPPIQISVTLPASVTDAEVDSRTTTSVTMRWTNVGSGLAVLIRRVVGTEPPRRPTDGSLVVRTDGAANTATDSGLEPGRTYSYALFADSGTEAGYAAPAVLTVSVPARASLAGRVTSTSGAALSGVRVVVTDTDGVEAGRTVTDGLGRWETAGLPSANYRACFSPADDDGLTGSGHLARCWADGTNSSDELTVLADSVRSDVDVVLDQGGALSGRVTDRNGAPLADVTVAVADSTGDPVDQILTGRDGDWASVGLANGDYSVCFDPATRDDPTAYTQTCFAGADSSPLVRTRAGSTTTGIDGTLSAAARTDVESRSRTTGARPLAARAISSNQLSSVACRDVLFLGARGSGQPGPNGDAVAPGDTFSGVGSGVLDAYTEFVAKITDGRTVTPVVAVSYPALPVTAIVTQAFSNGFVKSLYRGVEEARRALTERAVRCPNERIALAGYSQGAMVMKRVLRDTPVPGAPLLDSRIRARIDVAILIADGDRVAHDTSHSYGSAKASAQGVGTQNSRLSGADPTVMSAALGVRVFSVCDSGDVVCDFRSVTRPVCPECAIVRDIAGIRVHLGYAGSAVVRAAAADAATWAQSSPAFGGGPLPIVGSAGTPLFLQLGATYSKANIESLRWDLAPGERLPDGLQLGEGGFVSGTARAIGTAVLTLSVTATTGLGVTGPSIDVVANVRISDDTGASATPTWTRQNLPTPADGTTGSPSGTPHITCAAVARRTQCAGVGYYPTATGVASALWTLQDGRWTATKAIRTGTTSATDSWYCAPSECFQKEVSCGSSGMCAVIDLADDDTESDRTFGVWVLDGGTWVWSAPPLPANAGPSTGVHLQQVSCGATPLCALVLHYRTTDGQLRFAVGTYAAGRWTLQEPREPGYFSSYDLQDTSAFVQCGNDVCVARTRYANQGRLFQQEMWTWSHGRWTLGLPFPLGSLSYFPQWATCSQALCLAGSVGSFEGEAYHWVIWYFDGTSWHVMRFAMPPDSGPESARGEANDIDRPSCGGALCATVGQYRNAAGERRGARWVFEGTQMKAFALSSQYGSPPACSPTRCVSEIDKSNDIYYPSKGYWVGDLVRPLPSDEGAGAGVRACALGGCVAVGISGHADRTTDAYYRTPVVWSWTDGPWVAQAIGSEELSGGGSYVSCGEQQCVATSGTPGGGIWLSSPFRPEG